jgi:hypothetical protein
LYAAFFDVDHARLMTSVGELVVMKHTIEVFRTLVDIFWNKSAFQGLGRYMLFVLS